MIDPLTFFWLMFKAALVSTSGTGNLPILHQDFLARGWATEQQFAEALAIGQVSPGPTGLWVIGLGYLTDGPRGALLTAIAIALPPLLVLVVHGFYLRYGGHPAVEGFVRGLTLAVVGVFLTVLFNIMRTVGIEITSLLIMLGALALGATRRLPVIVVLALAALAGIIFY